ncbi:hypothetical protein [Pluralibacter sp.]|uniref:portal protein n=1 Tax=Pluralibacter sp. TaxID=1920032 RepID=UPI0025E2EF2D|nr:hypothetical protein [Pluralibacter sp.]MBV8042371.1 hypothetical protein [Pluralibacter sp.]
MNQKDLLTEVLRHKDNAVLRQTALQKRYAEAWGYYRGELPEVMQPGDIAARKVMWEAYETLHPSLVAIFTDDQKSPVAFQSDAFSENKLATAVTRAIHASALAVVDWDAKIYLALKEVLITGNQAALVGYDSKVYETDTQTFDKAPAQQAIIAERVLEKAGYNVESELTFEDVDGVPVVSGTMRGRREIKFPVINLIPFKDFYLHDKATSPENAIYCGYSEEITNAEAVKRGYRKTVVDKAMLQDTNAGRSMDTSMLVTGNLNAQGGEHAGAMEAGGPNSLITVFHHFWRGCYNTNDEKLWYVVTTGTEYLTHEEVAYCPLIWGAMSPVPNSAYGESLFDFCKSTQDGTTRARRAIQRSADFAAYPETEVVESMMTKKAVEALNDHTAPGRVYPVREAGAVRRIAAADVPQAMQILSNELSQDVERVKQGSANQSVAMEKTQQSGTAIALTQAKEEVNENAIAKAFAETFIKPAYRIFLMVQQEINNVFELDGDKIPFKILRDDIGLKVNVKSAGDRAQSAANVLNAYTAAVATGTLPANFQESNVYAIYADYLRAVTYSEDVDRYITPPSAMPKPSELQQKLKALMTACQLRHAIATTKLAETKVQSETADIQKTLNDAAKTLAEIEQIAGEMDIDKLRLIMEANKQDREALKDVKELTNDTNDQTAENQQA